MKKSGHHFPRDRGFSGSSSDDGKRYVTGHFRSSSQFITGYYRGGPVKRHDDAALDRRLIRQEIKKALKD